MGCASRGFRKVPPPLTCDNAGNYACVFRNLPIQWSADQWKGALDF